MGTVPVGVTGSQHCLGTLSVGDSIICVLCVSCMLAVIDKIIIILNKLHLIKPLKHIGCFAGLLHLLRGHNSQLACYCIAQVSVVSVMCLACLVQYNLKTYRHPMDYRQTEIV